LVNENQVDSFAIEDLAVDKTNTAGTAGINAWGDQPVTAVVEPRIAGFRLGKVQKVAIFPQNIQKPGKFFPL
jgi:hypothetical protein